ncbi:MAG: LptF/LptG family permease [Verrucomicrobia subdivision 3 bacterium]|nr:LptF/LptG family permease [Limisphaerales bacterium]
MRLLDRYLLRELFVPLFYCLLGFQIFWTAFDLFSQMDVFQSANMDAGDMARYYLLQTPELLTTVLPIALLLALLYTLTNHARHNELVAIRAAGVSLARLSVPYFGVALVLGGGLFLVTEFIAPRATAEASRLVKAAGDTNSVWLANLDFRDDSKQQVWHIKRYNPATGEMEQPAVDWVERDARYELFASRAEWKKGTWVFYDAQLQIYRPPANDLPQLLVTNVLTGRFIGGSPAQLQAEIRVTQMDKIMAAKRLRLSLGEIMEYQKLHPEMKTDRAALLKTQFHGRLAQPFTCLVVVFVAIPFGAMGGRRNVYAGVAGSVAICFFYFVLLRWGLALGTAGHIPALLAAWLPNLVFAGVGIVLMRKVP